MTSVFAIVRRILTQFARDKRTLALLFVAPLVVLWLLSVILGADTVGLKSPPWTYLLSFKRSSGRPMRA